MMERRGEIHILIVKMRRQNFVLLEDSKLGGACFEPMIRVYKSEQALDHDIALFYKGLTKGQQAVFMFYAHFNHANKSLTELYWWSAYFFAQPSIWSEIKGGLRYFKDDAMLSFFEDMEVVLIKHKHPRSLAGFRVTRDDLDRNQELRESMTTLNTSFRNIASFTLIRIGAHIRSNPDEFVRLED